MNRSRAAIVALAAVAAVAAVVILLAAWHDGDQTGADPAAAAAPAPPGTSRVVRRRHRDAAAGERPADASAETESAPAAAGPPASLVVRVLAPGALAGATVGVTDGDCTEWEGVTDDAGTVRFDELASGRADVRASAPGRLGASHTVLLAARAHETIDLELGVAVTLEGVVTDARTGRPLAAADVDLTQVSADDADGRALGEDSTDETGAFRFDGLPTGTSVRVRASAQGHTDAESTVVAPASGGVVRAELRLAGTGTLRGVVRTRAGAVVRGATVGAVPAVRTGGARPRSGMTDDEGTYTLDEVPLDVELAVTAESPGWAPSLPSAVRLTIAAPDAVCDLRLRDTASVVVRVSGRGGAVQATVQADGAMVWFAQDGVVRCTGLSPGDHVLRIGCYGLAAERRVVALGEGEQSEIDVRLEDGVSISGVVVDAAGAPIAGVWVFAAPADGPHEWSAGGATGHDGSFRVDGLSRGSYELYVFGSKLAGRKSRAKAGTRPRAEAPTDGVRLVAASDAQVTFRVLLPPGVERPRDLVVTQILALDADGASALPAPTAKDRVLPLGLERWTREGVVTCTIAARESWLRVCVPGFAPATMPVPTTELGTTIELGDRRMSPGLTLRGRVVDSGGRPLAGAAVTVPQGDPTAQPVRTDSDGAFAVAHVGPGSAFVYAESESHFGALYVEDASDAAALNVVARRAGTLRGTVVDESGARVSGAGVTIVHACECATAKGYLSVSGAERVARTTTDANGAFVATVTAGTCQVTATDGKVSKASEAKVPEDGEGTVTLTLEKP